MRSLDCLSSPPPKRARHEEEDVRLGCPLIFAGLRLRRIVKNNFGSAIHQLCFHNNIKYNQAPFGLAHGAKSEGTEDAGRSEYDASNLLVLVGGSQANVFDNEHIGNHLDILSHFTISGHGLVTTTSNPTSLPQCNFLGELLTVAFLPSHDHTDAMFVAAGTMGVIHIISLAYSLEVGQLSGHTGPITDLIVHPVMDNLLLSIASDNTVRLWNLESQICCLVWDCEGGKVACFDRSGASIFLGTRSGQIIAWLLPDSLILDPDTTATPKSDAPPVSVKGSVIELSGVKHLQPVHAAEIDCIRSTSNYIISKSVDGQICIWDSELQLFKTFLVKDYGNNHTSRFDVTLDESHLCVGTSAGAILIYELPCGKFLTELTHKRSSKAVRCCVWSRNCRSIIHGSDDAFLWRWDYIPKEIIENWKEKNSTKEKVPFS